MTTWVVVADSSRGRIFVQDQRKSALQEKEDFIHPNSRMHGRDLTSDRPGSDSGAIGQGRHVIDAQTEVKQHEAESFAHEIVDHLETGRKSGSFNKLVLMAPPAFLGTLRECLSDELRKMVVGELDKDLSQHSIEEVQEHLQQAMR